MRTHHHNRGYAVITLAVLFSALGLVLVLGGAVPIVSHYSSIKGYGYSKQALLASNSGVSEAIYRLKNGMNLPSSVTITLATSSAVVTTTTIPGGKSIAVTSSQSSYHRNFSASVSYGSGIAFNYGLQAGNGGVIMDGGSTIRGNVYSNSNIDAISSTITGTAIAADSSPLAADQSNSSPSTPPNSIAFRNASASQDFAQSFTAGTSTAINKIQFYIRKVGNPANATVRIVANNAGSPSTTEIPTGGVSLTASSVTTSYSWVDVVFTTKPVLVPGTAYWVVIDSGSQNSNNYYVIGANSSYAAGAAKTGAYSGSWTSNSYDGYFILYAGGITSTIGRANYIGGLQIGTGGEGDAWATNVKGTSVEGTIYCTTGSYNNKSCDTSRGSPPAVPLPFTDDNIQDWKDEAVAGGTITGNYTVGWQGASLGPKKITGNLTVNGGGTLTLNGTLWVQGNVTVNGGGKIKLPSGFGEYSGIIVADGWINISGGGSAGSGSSGSYLFVVSTSRCPNDINCGGASAITISGGAGAIAANAQSGTITLNGGAAINAIVANTIVVSGGGEVTYDQGLASPEFQGGPSGGFIVNSWKED